MVEISDKEALGIVIVPNTARAMRTVSSLWCMTHPTHLPYAADAHATEAGSFGGLLLMTRLVTSGMKSSATSREPTSAKTTGMPMRAK